jgi:trypsin
VNLMVFEEAACAAVPEYNGFLGAGVICAGSADPERDSCNGDSGGPLTRAEGRERVLVGLVSWGKGCGLAAVPGIYTDVATYRKWISDAMASAPAGQLSRM